MKKALVIGASSESVYAITVAQKRGYHVIAFDGNREADGLSYADESVVADIRDASQVWSRLTEKPDLILPVPIGRYLITAGAVNDYYGLRGLSEEAANYCTDKYYFHKRLSERGLRDGICLLLEEGTSATQAVAYAIDALQKEKSARGSDEPMIMKPRYGSGSRGVVLVRSKEDIISYLGTGELTEDLVLETVFPGEEYGIDAAVFDGRLCLFLIREKILTAPPYRQCVGYLAVDRRKEEVLYGRISEYLEQVVQILGLNHCLLHCDLMWDGNTPLLIELSGRPSGHNLHNLFTPLATGINMVDSYISYVEGKDMDSLSFSAESEERQLLIGYFDSEPCRLDKVPDASAIKKFFGDNLLQYDCHLQPGTVQESKDGHTLMERGYFILSGKSREELLQSRKKLLEMVFEQKG